MQNSWVRRGEATCVSDESTGFLQDSLLNLHGLEPVTQAMYKAEKMKFFLQRLFAIRIAEDRVPKVLKSKTSMTRPLDQDLESLCFSVKCLPGVHGEV